MIRIVILFIFIFHSLNLLGQRSIITPKTDSLEVRIMKHEIYFLKTDHNLVTSEISRLQIQPFFCKIEHKINARSPIPVFFRLGSKDYVDALEGK